jgi:small-conductance mechanosensitive channel
MTPFMPMWVSGAEHAHAGVWYALVWIVVVTLGLMWRAPGEERLWALRTSSVFFLALGALIAVKATFHFHAGTAYAVLRTGCLALEGLALIALTGRMVVDRILPRLALRAPTIIRDLVIAGASLFFFLVLLRAEGVEISALITTSAVVTVTLGIALQDTLGNLLGGLSLQLDDSINVGDWIRYDDRFGRVVAMTWRHISFETNGGERVVLPNSMLVKNKFTLMGRKKGPTRKWRRSIGIALEEAVSPSRVIDLIEKTLCEADIPGVAQDPKPTVVLSDLEKGCARYQVRYWLTDFTRDEVTDSAVRTHLYFALRRSDIALAASATEIEYAEKTHHRSSRIHPSDRTHALGLLAGMDIFAPLTEEERQALAEHIRVAPFAKGDVVTRQGATAHWLYIVADGEVEVVWESPDGQKHVVAEIGPRGFFGEMGLLTGEPRTATIIAKTDVVCWRIDKQAFLGVMQARPPLADALSKTLIARRDELDALRGRASQNPAAPKSDASDLRTRIRTFFGLDA